LLILCAGFASAAGAQVAPIVDGVPFLIRFGGTVRGLKPGAPVEVRGIRIGEVTSVGVDYAADSNGFVAPIGIVLQPSLFPAAAVHPRTAAEVYEAADVLVQRGLRAQISDTQLLGGDAIVTLYIQPDAAPATLDRSGKAGDGTACGRRDAGEPDRRRCRGGRDARCAQTVGAPELAEKL
jgi:paraquat-inducible protein B